MTDYSVVSLWWRQRG